MTLVIDSCALVNLLTVNGTRALEVRRALATDPCLLLREVLLESWYVCTRGVHGPNWSKEEAVREFKAFIALPNVQPETLGMVRALDAVTSGGGLGDQLILEHSPNGARILTSDKKLRNRVDRDPRFEATYVK